MQWSNRVECYLDELEECANTIDLILDETRVHAVAVKGREVDESTRQLQASLTTLETKIAERETLLHDADAPPEGLTLIAKLRSTLHVDDERLARRCEQIAGTIELAHTRAVSLFVCQYHLADLTGNLVRIMTRTDKPQTYKAAGSSKKQDPQSSRGGGLFDEAA
jgi:hypothetical protein